MVRVGSRAGLVMGVDPAAATMDVAQLLLVSD